MICAACGNECERTSRRQLRCVQCRKKLAVQKASVWYFANKDRKRAYDTARRNARRELYRAAAKRFRTNRPGRKNADTQLRRSAIRTPKWANKFFIREIYDLAAKRTKATSIRWVVDHVIPLRGKHVCGLHVETNLQVIPQAVNASKGNSFTHEGRA